jgi:hypothetical protein
MGHSLPTFGLEDFLAAADRYLAHEAANVIVFSGSAHHCHRSSLQRLIEDPVLQARVETIYILDTTAEHGWTKVYGVSANPSHGFGRFQALGRMA